MGVGGGAGGMREPGREYDWDVEAIFEVGSGVEVVGGDLWVTGGEPDGPGGGGVEGFGVGTARN